MHKPTLSRRIRILQLQPECHDRSHDPTDLAEQIVKAFPRERFEVTTAFLKGQPEPGAPASCAEHVHYFNMPNTALRGLRIGLHRTLWRYCRDGAFDVVICNRYKPVSTLMTLNRWLHTPLCIGISHGLGEYDRFWRRHFVAASITPHWRFVGVSPAVQEHLLDLGCGFTQENTVAITNALDLDVVEAMLLSRAAARQELGLPPSARIIGAIGRLVPVKGHIHLVQAFCAIATRHPDVHLAIIGEGNEATRLQAEVARHGMADRIHLLGWQTRAKRFVRAFDLWTMPSLSEGLGLALLEGMCGALPIIASDVPAMRPLIDGAGGCAVPPGNVTALAEALDQHLGLAPEALRTKGAQAYDYLRRNHTIDQYRNAYLQLVENALTSMPQKPAKQSNTWTESS